MEQKNNEIEVDIKELLFILLEKIWIIILAGIIVAVAAGVISKTLLKPIYTSTSKVYVINRQSSERTTLSDLQTGTQLTKDYKILVKSRPVTEQIISDYNLNITHEQLSDMITVNTPADTRILEIIVKHQEPIMAKLIADSLADVSAERMVNVMEMEKVNIIEQGNLPTLPSSPNVKRNTILGGLVGVCLAAFIVILVTIMNDSIKNSDDIEGYLGITTLGVIPVQEGISGKKNMNMKKQSRKKTVRAN